jgi:hypothetical protein
MNLIDFGRNPGKIKLLTCNRLNLNNRRNCAVLAAWVYLFKNSFNQQTWKFGIFKSKYFFGAFLFIAHKPHTLVFYGVFQPVRRKHVIPDVETLIKHKNNLACVDM